MAFIKTAIVFLQLDNFFLWNDHDDDKDTLCIVHELKGAAASGVTEKGPRLLVLRIIHHCFLLHYHLHQKMV